jgi:hypothetical protein
MAMTLATGTVPTQIIARASQVRSLSLNECVPTPTRVRVRTVSQPLCVWSEFSLYLHLLVQTGPAASHDDCVRAATSVPFVTGGWLMAPTGEGKFNALIQQLSPPPNVRRLRSGVRSAVWTDPARLSLESQEVLYHALPEVSARVFGIDLSLYWEHRRRNDMFGQLGRFYLFGDSSGETVGWATYVARRFAGRYCIYFDNAGITPVWRRKGVMRRTYERLFTRTLLRHPMEHVYLISRTANPVVYRGFQKKVEPALIYPAPDRAVPARMAALAEAVVEWLGDAGKLEVNHLTCRECYTPYFPHVFAERPRSGDARLDNWFDATLGPTDAFLVISKANIPTMVRHLMHVLGQRVPGRKPAPMQEVPAQQDHW